MGRFVRCVVGMVGVVVLSAATMVGIGTGVAGAAGPVFNSNPASGPPGTVITAWYITTCPPPGTGATVTVTLSQPGGAVVAQKTVSVYSGGQWYAQLTVPAGAASGADVLSARCATPAGTYLTYTPNSFTVTGSPPPPPPPPPPTVFTSSPGSGPPGTAITVSSSDACPPPGGAPSPTARVQLVAPDGSTVVSQGLFPVNSSGAWSGQFSVPPGAAAGADTLRAVCARSSGDVAGTIYATYQNQNPFTVTQPSPPPPPPPPPPGVTQISSDPFTNTTSQHQTQVEPDTFASGNTIVSTFQSGRFTDGGSSDLGWATSKDAGKTWTKGFLPSLTIHSSPAGPYERASDPSVAFDPRHQVWLISALAMFGARGAAVTVSRSSDGLTWSAPVVVASTSSTSFDKEWIVCDDHSSSPFYGNCYVTFDDNGLGDPLLNSTSTDGGLTWGPPLRTADNAYGFGGQPLVQPGGTVIVPVGNASLTAIGSYRSLDGGKSWTATTTVSSISRHAVAGSLRSLPLPSAGIDGNGRVFVAWSDCRFRGGCAANDIVMSSSPDGVTWSAVARVPIDSASGTVDHFIPGLAVDASTSGPRANVALTYYFYPNASCTVSTCQLNVGSISSTTAGSIWSTATQLNSTPMSVGWLANTNQGYMVGDYISTSFTGGKAVAVFALATAPDATFHEAMYSAILP